MIALVEAVRGGHVESRHRGSLVLLSPSGEVEVSTGDVSTPVFPRSSLKPLQAVAMLELGFAGRDGSLALAAASHDGEDVHVDGARATLASCGLDESALQCPPDLPGDRAAMIEWVAAGGLPARVCHNCSGKHAAMLSTCVANGWPVDSYRAPDHPLQKAIHARLESLCDCTVGDPVVDGCGAPAFAVPLTALAAAFGAVASATSGPLALVADAMRAHPRLIGGSERAVSQLMAAVPGLVAKEGAEGVWAAALPDGRAFAAKLEDGSARALPPLLAAAVRYWRADGADGAVVDRWGAVDLLGGGAPVGSVTCSPELTDLLGL